MLDLHVLKAHDLVALNPSEWAVVGAQLLAHIGEQSKHITAQGNRIDSQAQAIKWRDAKIESITFQLARLKAWKFGAKTERMNAGQRSIFEETLAADEASAAGAVGCLAAQCARPGRQGTRQGATPPAKARSTAAPPAARGHTNRA